MVEQDISSVLLAPRPCIHPDTEPVRLVKVNNTVEIRLLCLNPDCHILIGGQRRADHPRQDSYHTMVDRRGQNPPCARCGDLNTEKHHFAPTARFGKEEAERWPKGYYCIGCHVLWHRRMS